MKISTIEDINLYNSNFTIFDLKFEVEVVLSLQFYKSNFYHGCRMNNSFLGKFEDKIPITSFENRDIKIRLYFLKYFKCF